MSLSGHRWLMESLASARNQVAHSASDHFYTISNNKLAAVHMPCVSTRRLHFSLPECPIAKVQIKLDAYLSSLEPALQHAFYNGAVLLSSKVARRSLEVGRVHECHCIGKETSGVRQVLPGSSRWWALGCDMSEGLILQYRISGAMQSMERPVACTTWRVESTQAL